VTRYITFRFDDGFVEGARKASLLLHPSLASFFIVTGLVNKSIPLDDHPTFRGRDFGTPDEWRHIAALGHDVQPHSVSHPNFRDLSEDGQALEVLGSIAAIRDIHSGPYVFAFPYNAITDLDLSSLGISAAGFVTESSDQDVLFNKVKNEEINLFGLRSWAVRERHYERVIEQIGGLPDDSWTILAFHSLDGEGHEPWTSDGFARLIAFVRTQDFRIVSIIEALQALSRRWEFDVLQEDGVREDSTLQEQ
jgi:peptidoglycan/xylan/chitin deacetylase (PgdA/CDA1 family)